MSQFAQPTHSFDPPEDLLDQLPFPLTDGVACVTRGPAINGAVHLLRDVRRDPSSRTAATKPRTSKPLSPPTVLPGGALASSNRCAASRSAVPVAGVTHTFATSPCRLSSRTWPA